MSETIDREDKIESLVEYRRSQLTDGFVTDYDYIDKASGHKMKEEKVEGPDGVSQSVERNQTHIYQSGPSTTDNVEMLVIEAKLAEEGKDLPNPHIPIGMDTLEEAKNRIEAKDLTPAWAQ